MAPAKRDAATRSAIVPALVRYLAAAGLDDGSVRFELVAEPDEASVQPATIVELLEHAARVTGDPALALRLPGELPMRRYSLAEVAVRASATIRDALARLPIASLHPHLEAATLETADELVWCVRTPKHPRGISRHVHELALAYARHFTGATPTRVWFAHARPRDLTPILYWAGFDGADALEFGVPDSGFAISRAAADAPLPTSDARLLATVHDLAPDAARPHALAPDVVALIRDRLPEVATADEVADQLHMSARTLQRRLEAEHTSFTMLVDTTRQRLARELLANHALPLAEIAYRLGFSDLATFSRAFKRWTGRPPGLFRRS